jgi:hypothetical protein
MTTRDDYIKKLKDQLDRWNVEISKLEAKAKKPLVGAKDAYDKRLSELRAQRNAMQKTVTDIQKASDHAWDNLRKGADTAWKAMEDRFKKAWSAFK